MTTEKKQEIVHHLNQAQGDNLLVTSIRNFVNNINSKRDNDYLGLIKEIKEDIIDNAKVMLGLFGETSYQYFKTFQLPTDFAPVTSEGIE